MWAGHSVVVLIALKIFRENQIPFILDKLAVTMIQGLLK